LAKIDESPVMPGKPEVERIADALLNLCPSTYLSET
jgi:hypothetical protein